MKEIIQTNSDWKSLLELLSAQTVLAVDTEYVDEGYPNIKLVGFSLAWMGDNDSIEGTYVPVAHEKGENLDPKIWKHGLSKILQDKSKQIIGHNFKSDISVFQLYKIYPHENIYDTIICEWLLNTTGVGTTKQMLADKGKHGLAPLIEHYFDYEMTKLGDIVPKIDDIFRPDLVTPEELAKYAVDDVVWLFKLRQHQLERFELEPRLWRIYQTLERRLLHVLVDMERFGVEIDDNQLKKMGNKISSEIFSIYEKMYSLRPGQDWEEDELDSSIVLSIATSYEDLEKEKDLSPYEKGRRRKEIFSVLGEKHPLEEKVRDDALRPEIIKFPHLAYKIFNPNSTHQLNQVLFDECEIEPLGKTSKESVLYSTSAENIEKWAEDNEIAEHLNRLRVLSKLYGTYVQGILERLRVDRRISTSYNRIIATGRLSSRDPNLQNIVNSKEFPIRRVFVGTGIADSSIGNKGEVEYVKSDGGVVGIRDAKVVGWKGINPQWPLLVADYSQLEIRILAHLSGDETLLNALREGQDIHGLTATIVFSDEMDGDIDPNDVKTLYPDLRTASKPVNFGIIYGIGAAKLAKQIGRSKKEADEIINRYMAGYAGVKKWRDKRHQQAKNEGYVETLLGRKRHIPLGPFASDMMTKTTKAKDYNDWKYKLYRAQRIAGNSPIQGTAADIIDVAMVQIRDWALSEGIWGFKFRMLIQVHDEIVSEVHPSIANEVLEEVTNIMESGFRLKVPLIVDSALGFNWQETKA